MSNTPPSAPPPSTVQSSEISLEDIDRLLEAEDPEFTKSLDEVRAVADDKDVVIEASAIDESLSSDDKFEDKPETRIGKIKARIRLSIYGFRVRLKARFIQAGKDFLIFLKTRPKEFFFFSLATLKVLLKQSTVPIKAFRTASSAQRLAALVLIALVAGCVWVLLANVKGIWLPQLNQPILHSFEKYAEDVETFDPKDDGESFYSAFPQERHEFLFPKIKVNLRRTPDSPLPMGAFEMVVEVDSKDSAIEIRDREVEFLDLVQRVFEEETFNDLETELGKAKVKSALKRELNQKLTQGWVKEISFKTFILKP